MITGAFPLWTYINRSLSPRVRPVIAPLSSDKRCWSPCSVLWGTDQKSPSPSMCPRSWSWETLWHFVSWSPGSRRRRSRSDPSFAAAAELRLLTASELANALAWIVLSLFWRRQCCESICQQQTQLQTRVSNRWHRVSNWQCCLWASLT